MQIQVLGCSGGIGAGLRTTALLVDGEVLIDAGTGVGDLPVEAMRSIRHVFLTHSHLDHVVGLPLLVDALYDELTEPLVVHALPATLDALRNHVFNDVLWPDFSRLPDSERPVLRFDPLRPGETRQLGALTIEPIEVAHSVPAVGYYCTNGVRAFAFSGDTTTNDTFWRTLNQHEPLDLLMVEVGFPSSHAALADLAGHYTPERLAADLARLEHSPCVAVTHLKPGAEDRTLAEVAAALPEREVHRLRSGETYTL